MSEIVVAQVAFIVVQVDLQGKAGGATTVGEHLRYALEHTSVTMLSTHVGLSIAKISSLFKMDVTLACIDSAVSPLGMK